MICRNQLLSKRAVPVTDAPKISYKIPIRTVLKINVLTLSWTCRLALGHIWRDWWIRIRLPSKPKTHHPATCIGSFVKNMWQGRTIMGLADTAKRPSDQRKKDWLAAALNSARIKQLCQQHGFQLVPNVSVPEDVFLAMVSKRHHQETTSIWP